MNWLVGCSEITSGVGDHQMDAYVDHLGGQPSSYRWDKYERATRQRRSAMPPAELEQKRRASLMEEELELTSARGADGAARAKKILSIK